MRRRETPGWEPGARNTRATAPGSTARTAGREQPGSSSPADQQLLPEAVVEVELRKELGRIDGDVPESPPQVRRSRGDEGMGHGATQLGQDGLSFRREHVVD